MTSAEPLPISIDDAIRALTFLSDRTPTTTAEESKGAFTLLSSYRDGGVFVATGHATASGNAIRPATKS
jgi:hypothetical protein